MLLYRKGLLSCRNVTNAILRASKIQVMAKIDMVRAKVLDGMLSFVICSLRTPILAHITTAK